MHRRYCLGVIFLVPITLLAASSAAADDCDHCGQVLLNEYPTTFSKKTSGSFQSKVWNYFCSSDFETRQKGIQGTAEVTVPIDGVPVPFGASGQYNDSWTKRSQACQAGSNSLSMEEAAQVYFRLVPERVQLNAQNTWLECHRQCSGSRFRVILLESRKVSEKRVNFTLKLSPDVPLAYVTGVESDNLQCNATLIEPLAKITASGLGASCVITDVTKTASLTVIPSSGEPVSAAVLPQLAEEKPTPTPTPIIPSSVDLASAAWEGSFSCPGEMSCADGKVLSGVKDGTGCGVMNSGLCTTPVIKDQFGREFGRVQHLNCVPLPQYSCGQSAECPAGKVLIGYKDGTGCGVLNGGMCCDLGKDNYRVTPVANSCGWVSPFTCGNSGSCPSGQVMVGIKDGTGCGVENMLKCCAVEVK